MNEHKRITIIGAGPVGIEAACILDSMGYNVELIEKSDHCGGNAAKWDRLFPTLRPAQELIDYLQQSLKNSRVHFKTNIAAHQIQNINAHYRTTLSDGSHSESDAVLITTGYDLFKAEKKEEYGYGIYDHVITSADLEGRMKSGKPIINNNSMPKRIAFIHCVGSRDEKTNNLHCSKVCCVTGVKQAIELREKFPTAEIICFYMDLRMYGRHFEELYREAQEKYAIQFIRGRLSEAAENLEGSIQIKAEDTLSGRPLKMIVDLMVLLVGMEAPRDSRELCVSAGIQLQKNGFILPLDENMDNNSTNKKGIFAAGAATGPMSISDALADARSAAIKIKQYLQ